jgi:hypothetical protein
MPSKSVFGYLHTHFWCANRFLGFWHVFFGWGFILRCGTFFMIFFLRDAHVALGILFFVCHLLTFFFCSNKKKFFFFRVFCDEFWHESFASVWSHYGSWVMGVYSKPSSGASTSINNLLWWHRPIIYGKLCPIFFFTKLGFGDFICVFKVSHIWQTHFGRLCFLSWGGPYLFQSCLHVAQDSILPAIRDLHRFFLKFDNDQHPGL